MAYWFSLLIWTDKSWSSETIDCVLELEDFRPITIQSYDHNYGLNDVWDRTDVEQIALVLSSSGFSSKEEANESAKKLCNSLVLAAGFGVPVDPGFTYLLNNKNPWEIGQGEYKRRLAGYSGGTWPKSGNIASIGDDIAKYSNQPDCSLEQIRACANICNAVLPRGIKTSLDYGYTLFMARISAIESLAPDIEKNQRIRRFLDEAISELESKSYLTVEDRTELRRTLGNAKQESIAAKCKTFIREHSNTPNMPTASNEADQYGLSAEKRFRMMYTMRSTYTHGSVGPEENITTLPRHDTARQCGIDAESMVRLYLLNKE